MLADNFDLKPVIMAFILNIIAQITAEEKAFIVTMMLAVFVDTLLGTLVAFKTKTFNSTAMKRPLYKIVVYAFGLGTAHVTAEFAKSAGAPNPFLDYTISTLDALAFAYVLMREVTSIAENSHKLGVPILPPAIRKRMSKLTNSGRTDGKD
jgi:phage-related holin